MWPSSALAFFFFFFPLLWESDPLVHRAALCNLLECSKAAECPLLLCQALTRGLSSVGWEGLTLEDFGSECLRLRLLVQRVRVCDVPPRTPRVLRLLITCIRRLSSGCMRVFSSHSGTLPPPAPPERCASQSAERQHDLKQVPREEKKKTGPKKREKTGGRSQTSK